MFQKKNHKAIPYILLFILTLVQYYFLVLIHPIIDNIIMLILSTFIFYLLISSISKKLLNFFIILSLIVTCFIFPTQIMYGKVDYNYILSIYYTNSDEIFSYIKIIPYYVYLQLIALGVFSFYLVKTKKTKVEISKSIKVFLLVALLSLPFRMFIMYRDIATLDEYFYVLPLKKIALLDIYINIKKEDEFIKKESKKESSWVIEKKNKSSNHNVVVVIGESVRKDFLHSYGFPISNTPFIDNSKNIQFNNQISVSFSTVSSLLRTITLPNSNYKDYQLNNNIVSLAKIAEYKTYWISNTSKFGMNDSPISVIAEQSDSCLFISAKDHHKDIDMLPVFNDVLSKNSNDSKFIILHMVGSHPYAVDRTDGVYDEFVKSKEISCYNKTIKNLDDFLKEIHQKLQADQKPYNLVYFSDHGLKLNDNDFIHNGSVKDAYNVPLLLWNDTLTSSKEINGVRRGFDFLHLMSEVLGVKTKNIQKKYKFISEEKNEDVNIKILDRDGNISDYEKLKDNPASVLFEKIKK